MNKKQNRIPYRESKMTRILGLGQNKGLTIMVLNLAPTRAYHLDTISSLNFASRTKKIEVAEVENDPVLKTMSKPLASSFGGATMKRQPLRALTAAANINVPETGKEKKGEKPVKAFSVYSDSRKPVSRVTNLTSQNQGVRRTETQKRTAETSSGYGTRPAKTFRAADSSARSRTVEAGMTKEAIEALIAQRLDERLAEKALQDAAAAAPAISDELQKRLDDLEQRIDAKEDDGKSQGLQFLLMAKQHHARGEDASALRMYHLAEPYFPGNDKLQAKMKSLEDRIRAKREAEQKHMSAPAMSAPTMSAPSVSDPFVAAPVAAAPVAAAPAPSRMAPLKAEKKAPRPKMVFRDDAVSEDEDEEFAPPPPSDHEADSFASEESFVAKPKAARRPKKTLKRLPVFRDELDSSAPPPGAQTPRTERLLGIINSRDVNQIKGLKGVGLKKADAIVNCLMEMDNAEVHDLASLALLKGVSGKTVENMRMGLGTTMVGEYDF
jgi:DNA uptake protein ComE-like DNA-binding protein